MASMAKSQHNLIGENQMNTTVENTNEVTETEVTEPVVVVTKRGVGRPRESDSKAGKARALMAGIGFENLKSTEVVPRLVSELGMSKATAQVYFYNIKKEMTPVTA